MATVVSGRKHKLLILFTQRFNTHSGRTSQCWSLLACHCHYHSPDIQNAHKEWCDLCQLLQSSNWLGERWHKVSNNSSFPTSIQGRFILHLQWGEYMTVSPHNTNTTKTDHNIPWIAIYNEWHRCLLCRGALLTSGADNFLNLPFVGAVATLTETLNYMPLRSYSVTGRHS